METAGFVLPNPDAGEDGDDEAPTAENERPTAGEPRRGAPRSANPENYSVEELERTLDRLIRNENYEEAARINEILQRKRRER